MGKSTRNDCLDGILLALGEHHLLTIFAVKRKARNIPSLVTETFLASYPRVGFIRGDLSEQVISTMYGQIAHLEQESAPAEAV
jgi:hypothetical protein